MTIDRTKGAASGERQRLRDQEAGVYPRSDRPIGRGNPSPEWIEAYQEAYKNAPKAVGRPMIGDEPRVTISVIADRGLVDAVRAAGIPRADCFEVGARSLLLEQQKLTLNNPKASKEDILYEFAMETHPGHDTLDRYLREYPQYAAELIDLSIELSREVSENDEPLSAEDLALIDKAWQRHVDATVKAPGAIPGVSQSIKKD
jgi:hypothetical protein